MKTTTIFIPKTIRVGYQTRSDTYTKSLGYVIYYDQKGVLRKEPSWQSWRDKKIEPTNFENAPTSGFVLNKKVGDYTSDWNHRSAACRVYDPRNFEFEITIENLLYILQNTNSIKGKGLEGEFVYGWSGSDMLLIPVESPDYVKIETFTEMITKPELIKGKDLVLGGTYRTKQNDDWIYMGRFERYQNYSYTKEYGKPEGLYYFFYGTTFQTIKSLSGKIVYTVSTEAASNYAELMDKLTHKSMFSPVNKDATAWIRYTEEEIDRWANRGAYSWEAPYIYFNNEYRQIGIQRRYNGTGYYLTVPEYGYLRGYERENKLHDFHNSVNPNKDMSLRDLCNIFDFYKRTEYLMNGQTKEY